QRLERGEEALVGDVVGRDRTLAAPAGAAQGVQPTVVAGAGEGVRGDRVLLVEGLAGELRPRPARGGETGGDGAEVLAGVDGGAGGEVGVVLGQVRRLGAEEVLVHGASVAGGARRPAERCLVGTVLGRRQRV